MRNDNDAASLRMNEHVVRAPDPFQDSASLLQLADKVGASHGCVLYTQQAYSDKTRFVYAITCIVSQVAASAGFCVPSTSTLTS
jgi:hypothetical protein